MRRRRSAAGGRRQDADATADGARQETVLVAETAAERERFTLARRPVVEPRRLVVGAALQSVVGVQLTVLRGQVRRRRRRLARPLTVMTRCNDEHVTRMIVTWTHFAWHTVTAAAARRLNRTPITKLILLE